MHAYKKTGSYVIIVIINEVPLLTLKLAKMEKT